MNLLKNKKKFSGGALILQMFLAVCFMVWLFPVNAFAAYADWSEIRNTVLDVYQENSSDEASGSGWTYSNGTVTIAEGTIVEGDVAPFGGESSPAVNNIHSNGGIFIGTIESGNFTGTVINEGTINGGTFNGEVTNRMGHYIYGGTFTNAVTNEGIINGGTFTNTVTNERIIEGGTFNGAVTSENGSQITGGTFNGAVTSENGSQITNGIFNGAVTSENGSRITNGTFNGAVTSENGSQITNGTFTDTVTNKGSIYGGTFEGTRVTNEGSISGGTFEGTVTNEGSISKGRFDIIRNKVNGMVSETSDVIYNQLINEGNGSNPNPNPGDDEGNTPPQNPGNNDNNTSNSNNNTDNDKEYVFVEPVVIVVPEGQKYVEDVLAQLEKVPTDGKVVIDTKDWYCFNRTLAEKVTSMKDVTVIIKYMYQGKKYEVTIPAGSDVVSLLGETGFVGFRYLDLVFSGREITE